MQECGHHDQTTKINPVVLVDGRRVDVARGVRIECRSRGDALRPRTIVCHYQSGLSRDLCTRDLGKRQCPRPDLDVA